MLFAPAARLLAACGGLAVFLLLAGCRQDMHDQPRYEALEPSAFFPDGRSVRPQVRGTVARGEMESGTVLLTGRVDGALTPDLPLPLTRELLSRGRQRFEIFCTPCHGQLGDGNGIVTQRGFRHPPSYHSERLRGVPVGHFFDVITRGFGAMTDFSDRIPPEDRWAIAAYIRALQYSRQAKPEDLPADMRRELERSAP
jgi:mono/diheme cytochrome c family protein